MITPLGRENWIKRKRLSFKITDKASGIKSYRGTIDGNFAVFEYDPKTNTIFYNFDAARLEKEQQHSLILNVEDNCNNVKQYSTTFFW